MSLKIDLDINRYQNLIKKYFRLVEFSVRFDGEFWEIGFGYYESYDGFFFLDDFSYRSNSMKETIAIAIEKINHQGDILDRIYSVYKPVKKIEPGHSYTYIRVFDTIVAYQLFHVGVSVNGDLMGYGKLGDQLFVSKGGDGLDMYITERIDESELRRIGIDHIL